MTFNRAIRWVSNVATSERARSTGWAFVGLAVPTLMQLIYMIAAARILGAHATGLLLQIVAVALIASAFVGLGGGGLILREVARDRAAAPKVFGQAKAMAYLTFPFLLPLVVLGGWFATKGEIPIWIVICIGASDLLATRLVIACWSLFVAREQQVKAALMICAMPLVRLLALVASVSWPEGARFGAFAVMYSAGSFLVMAGALQYVRHTIGDAPLKLSGFDRRAGASFSLTWLNAALQTESDKLIVGLFGTPALVAVYSVASRLMDGAAMPPRALRVAIQSRLFREGAGGHRNSYDMTIKMIPVLLIYGVIVWAGFSVFAPVFVWIFGPEFTQLAEILPILGALPLLKAVADYGAEIFMSSDRPEMQAGVQSAMTILRIVLGAILVSSFGLHGAVFSALLCTALSALVLWGIAWRMKAATDPKISQEKST